jgi:hypothetical protein
LEKFLPNAVNVREVSVVAKIPFKVIVLRESLFWRAVEFSKSAFENLDSHRLAAGITLARAFVETVAANHYLYSYIHKVAKDGVLESTDSKIMRMLMGTKTMSELPDPVHVNDFLRALDKEFPNAMKIYDRLSEFTHPNWSGTAALFSVNDEENLMTRFGVNLRSLQSPLHLGYSALVMFLAVLEFYYNKISDIMPEFTQQCELDIQTRYSPS